MANSFLSPALHWKRWVEFGRTFIRNRESSCSGIPAQKSDAYVCNQLHRWLGNKSDVITMKLWTKTWRSFQVFLPGCRCISTNHEKTGKKIKDIFLNFNLFVYGGVNFEPTEINLSKVSEEKLILIELYPARRIHCLPGFSERQSALAYGEFRNLYEFIPVSEYFNTNPTRIPLKDVELGVNYAIILNTNAGLWGYSFKDTIKFVSKIRTK